MTRSPWAVLTLALLDGAVGAAFLAEALRHGARRDVLAHFFVYLAIVFAFKARDAARRLPALVAQARTANGLLLTGPWWLRTTRARPSVASGSMAASASCSRASAAANWLVTISPMACT